MYRYNEVIINFYMIENIIVKIEDSGDYQIVQSYDMI